MSAKAVKVVFSREQNASHKVEKHDYTELVMGGDRMQAVGLRVGNMGNERDYNSIITTEEGEKAMIPFGRVEASDTPMDSRVSCRLQRIGGKLYEDPGAAGLRLDYRRS